MPMRLAMAIRRAARRKHSLMPSSPRPELIVGSPTAAASAAAPGAPGDPRQMELLLRSARRAAFAGDDAAAIPLYVQAISLGCASPMAFNDLGTLLAKRGHLPPAVVQFEIALTLEPGSARVSSQPLHGAGRHGAGGLAGGSTAGCGGGVHAPGHGRRNVGAGADQGRHGLARRPVNAPGAPVPAAGRRAGPRQRAGTHQPGRYPL